MLSHKILTILHDHDHNHALLLVSFQVSSRSTCCTTTSTTHTLLSVRPSRQTLIYLLCFQVTKAAVSLLLSSSSLQVFFLFSQLIWSTQLTATTLSYVLSPLLSSSVLYSLLIYSLSSSVLCCAVRFCLLPISSPVLCSLPSPLLSCPVLSSHLSPPLSSSVLYSRSTHSRCSYS